MIEDYGPSIIFAVIGGGALLYIVACVLCSKSFTFDG